MSAQPNPFQQFQNLMEYLGEVDRGLEERKIEKEGYQKLLQTYLGSLRLGKFDLEFYGIVQTLAKETNRLYSQDVSKGWVKEAIRRSPWIYDNIAVSLQLYKTLFTQRNQLLEAELADLTNTLQTYQTTIQNARKN